MQRVLKEIISKAAKAAGFDVAPDSVPIEHPAELANGDYSSGIALQYAKQMGIPPRELAEKIVGALGEIEGIQKIEIAGAGFINLYLASSELSKSIEEAREEPWGRNDLNKGKKIMVEYTDPNPFKEFHIGHLMSNAIGESISRLLQFSSAEVKRANYQGDVGPHVAKAIWGRMKASAEEKWGASYARGAEAYESDPAAKAEIDEINKKVYEKSDAEINQLYEEGRKSSLEEFEELYKILGTKFDFYFFESVVAQSGLEVVKSNPDVFEESDGAIVYKGEQDGFHTRVFVTSKGLPTYETKELGLAKLKTDSYAFDSSITVTANEQKGYFEVVVAAMKKVLPTIAPKVRHVSHGMMRFAEGKMSSRTGNVVTGRSLLHELIEAAKVRAAESRADDPEVLAEAVAVAAIKYQVLKQRSEKDIIFDRERALSLEGDSGPYLQYAHARAHAVVEKAKEQNVTPNVNSNGEPTELSRLLHRFPEAVEYAARELEPHLLTNYLLEFASAFNRWYANEQILDGTSAAPHKVALADAARATLKNGLWLLGIPAPEKM